MDFPVIHLCLSNKVAKSQIPLILKMEPVTTNNELGSKNYTAIPKAVIMGAGYSDSDVDSIRKACLDAQTPLVPWLRPDTRLPTPSLGPEYCRALVARIKALMMDMKKDKQESGKIEFTDDIVYY
ncbi:hypothetical protein HYFRA_00004621 [Hymenoscyphus fraxineus]|uniref:Uncharacterized protein n=1 Tax=Hymenoscyphus fraxineus TaxID=746836 RepID=A0A9N9KWE6_9HELO|nr:hypothetical protein HYFRA_00004621 [Hymenoscyphus fraxineus]